MLLWRLLLPALLAASPALAEPSQDRARAALQWDQIAPLEEILAAARASGIGQVLEIELELVDGRWVYEIEELSRDGMLANHYFDAATKERLPDDLDTDASEH